MSRTVGIEFTNNNTFDEREVEDVTALDLYPVTKNGKVSDFIKVTNARGYFYVRRELITVIEDVTQIPENPILTDLKNQEG